MPPPPDLAYAPALLVVADTPAAAARAHAAARSAVAASLSLDEAAAHLAGGAVPDLVLLEIDGDHAPALETILSMLETAASTRYPSIVSTPAMLIDLVAARAPGVRVQLADATDADRVDALRIARTPTAARVRETRAAAHPAATDPVPDPDLAAQIRDLLRTRRLRARYFDPALFADPAWDMLLDLMAARIARTRVAVSSLCIAAAVPPTTALRWIKTLTDCGLCARVADPADGRRVFIDLSDEAADALRAYLAEIRRTS